MAGKGGYQPPANPAPVSGPGSMSRRTDGGPGQAVRDIPAQSYGDASDFRAVQEGAPMAAAQAPPSGAPAGGSPAPVVPLGAPTQNPDEPITAGAPFGPGPGPADPQAQADADTAKLLPYLPMLERRAQSADASETLRNIVTYLKGFQG